MSKIDKLCNEMIEEHRRAETLLSGAQNILNNQEGHCPVPSCTPEDSCRGCRECKKMIERIESYLND